MNLTGFESGLKKVGHDLVVAGKAIEQAAVKVGAVLTKDSPVINAVLADIDPSAAGFAEFGESLAAKLIGLIGDGTIAADAKGASVSFDETVIADAKALWAAFKGKIPAPTTPAAQ